MSARIYTRYSPRPVELVARDEHEAADSTAGQVALCQGYCRTKGWEIAGVHSDEAVSGGGTEGKSADKMRGACPALWDAIDNLKRGDVLVVESHDRLSREQGRFWAAVYAVKARRARIEFVRGGAVNSDDPADKLRDTMIVAVAEYARVAGALRTKDRMLAMQRGGRCVSGQPPYGWTIVPNGAPSKRTVKSTNPLSSEMRLDEREAELVTRVHALAGEGLKSPTIAKRLSEEGWTARTGGPVYDKMVRRILERGVLSGSRAVT